MVADIMFLERTVFGLGQTYNLGNEDLTRWQEAIFWLR
jgi:hypothetical protein